MFGPNDNVTESDLRRNLMTGPAEDEVITAAAGVAPGIKNAGNEQILGQVASPAFMFSRERSARVTSRLILSRPEIGILQTASSHGALQIDLRLAVKGQKTVALDVSQGSSAVYGNRVNLKSQQAGRIEYTHRLDLLPGTYSLTFTVDGTPFVYPLEVPEKQAMGEIVRADVGPDVYGRHTPFEFSGRQIALNPAGRFALVPVPERGKVTWQIHQGFSLVWRSASDADGIALVELPSLPPGHYRLEAATANDSRGIELTMPLVETDHPSDTLVSFNANLAPERRLAFLGNQWLLRGRLDLARETLNESLARRNTKDVQIALARLDAVSGRLDAARDRVRGVLAANPDDFEALSVLAYIETRFQDYPAAAELYRHALAVQDSPALRMALANLPER
jgi:hypothetical protein